MTDLADRLEEAAKGWEAAYLNIASSLFAEAAREYRAALRRVEALEADNARLKADAARYHWLRDISCPPHNFYVSIPDEFHGVLYSPEDVDAYIDQARALMETNDAH